MKFDGEVSYVLYIIGIRHSLCQEFFKDCKAGNL